ncbi:MAG: DUF4863 family protein [Alphaproteobacteria bacterium]|nr:DUF4863 family protein [Alphaproteobacteria bacterium]
MSQAEFEDLMGEIAGAIADKPVDAALQTFLNETFNEAGDTFAAVEALCRSGEAEGWICDREMGGIRFGRVIKPGGAAGRFSVDVVRMKDIKGPHHIHPNGEIGMIMPIAGDPRFDGEGRGWYVDPPGSDHWPTVEGGEAYVLYLLPEGAIEFTGK